YLKLGQSQQHLAELETTWAQAMTQLVGFLYEQNFKDSMMAKNLTLYELPNLMALLERLENQLDADNAEAISDVAGKIEQLLADLNRPPALARAAALRQKAAEMMPEWGRTRFRNQRLRIERLLQKGQLQPAYQQAQELLEKAQTAGPAAYSGANYDLGLANFMLGRVLRLGGQAAPALEHLTEAQRLFEALGERGASMASGSLTEQADCLTALGRLDEAVEKYEQSIKRFEKLEDFRWLVVGKVQLADVLNTQGKHNDAIASYEEARAIFEQQNEPASVATAWHQIGVVYQDAGRYEQAEVAYRRSLDIETQNHNRAGQGFSLVELGRLYSEKLNRQEDAVVFYRQATDIAIELGDLKSEGVRRNNIADTLRKLKRYDEARVEIERAIECKKELGHAGTVWNAYGILQEVETAQGRHEAARAAWVQARQAYFAYRQQGGYAQFHGGKLVEHILGLVAQQKTQELDQVFALFAADSRLPESRRILLHAVQTILNGSRDTALADDPALNYSDAAEILFLIERLKVQ
ncbi:MAG: tetratricopeptide repeat protein, partial [Calditrichaeota bacterium]